MANKQIDIGVELGKGWELYKANMGLLVVASLIGMVISGFTCGILGGPMSAGVFLIVRRLLAKDPVKPQAGDVFKGFDYFLQAFLLFILLFVASFVLSLVLNFIPVLGQLASMVVSIFIGSVMMWGILFVVHQKLTAIDAIQKLIEGLKSGEMMMPLLLGAVACFMSGLGVVACFVGLIFTAPFSYCCLGCAYETLYGDKSDAATVVEPEVMPPPASDLRL
jgi:hypothetical protein